MATLHEHLFQPLKIRHIAIENRIVRAAMWLLYAEADGSIGDRILAHYESVARGGVGLVTVEESMCDYPGGASGTNHIRLDEDRFIPGLARLAQTIHRHCPAIVQITHAGPACSPEHPVAPSKLEPPVEPFFAIARELTLLEIKGLVEKFAQAALRVKKAGFDGVEVHMAHYALVNAFLSRIQNKRHDEYGCDSIESRSRFSCEILGRIRELCGNDFVIGLRMNGKEWGHPLGTTPEEAAQFAQRFEKAGADYIQVSAYGYGAFGLCAVPELVSYPETPPEARGFAARIPEGALLPETDAIKKAVKIPISGVGTLSPAAAEIAVARGQIDLVYMGRALLADPDAPAKLKEGRESEIRPCVRCNVCLSDILLGTAARCRVNAFLGNEGALTIRPAERRMRVLVVGAGPAGCEAARVAALRGHSVSLYDAAPHLGGLLPMAAFIKGTDVADNLSQVIEYYKRELPRLKVETHLATKVDAEVVRKAEPNVVILATGGKPLKPLLPGLDRERLMTTEAFFAVVAPVLQTAGAKASLPLGDRVVIHGGDAFGLEMAEFLVKRGRQVTILEEGKDLGVGMPLVWLVRALPWLAAHHVVSHVDARWEGADGGVVRVRKGDGASVDIPADTVLHVSKYGPNEDLCEELKRSVSAVHRIGDARGGAPGYVQGAIADGARIGASV